MVFQSASTSPSVINRKDRDRAAKRLSTTAQLNTALRTIRSNFAYPEFTFPGAPALLFHNQVEVPGPLSNSLNAPKLPDMSRVRPFTSASPGAPLSNVTVFGLRLEPTPAQASTSSSAAASAGLPSSSRQAVAGPSRILGSATGSNHSEDTSSGPSAGLPRTPPGPSMANAGAGPSLNARVPVASGSGSVVPARRHRTVDEMLWLKDVEATNDPRLREV